MTTNHPHRIRFGPYLVDLHSKELWKSSSRIRLSGQPFEILAILLRNAGQVVSREQLRDLLWPNGTFVDFDHGLSAAVNKLRDALLDSAETPRYVETLPRRGYRFMATIESEEQKATPNASPPTTALTELRIPVAPRSRRLYFIAANVLLVLLLAGTLLWEKVLSTSSIQRPFSPVQQIKPLTDLSDETSQPAFSPDGNLLAFRLESSSPGGSGLFVQSISGVDLRQLTRDDRDCCPVWSPDGRSIAFTRSADHNEYSIYTIPLSADPSTTQAHKLDTARVAVTREILAWSPQENVIAFSGPDGLFLLSTHNSMVHRLTQTPPASQDGSPSFSPDGSRLLFVRSGDSGVPDQILCMFSSGGEPTPVVSENAHVLGPPQWSTDGQSVIFASGRGSHPGLWRVSAFNRESPVQINDSGWYPAISRHNHRLAYQRIIRSLDIWQLNLSARVQQPRILVPATSETDQGPGPQMSPDGTKLAYMSDRSGTMEIWVSDRDGSHPRQLTAIGNAGTPRWSPDSQSIVFDAGQRNGVAIYTLPLTGGSSRVLVQDQYTNVCPAWSHDGKWVYFASPRSGQFQVWKIPAQGGSAVPVTLHGGHAAFPSWDGKYIYYAKTQYANPEIWEIPVNGGAETPLSRLVRPVTWASWSVVREGIVFAQHSGQGKPVVTLFNTSTHRTTRLGTLNIVPFWLAASPDAGSVVFDQPGWQKAQIMLVDNFR